MSLKQIKEEILNRRIKQKLPAQLMRESEEKLANNVRQNLRKKQIVENVKLEQGFTPFDVASRNKRLDSIVDNAVKQLSRQRSEGKLAIPVINSLRRVAESNELSDEANGKILEALVNLDYDGTDEPLTNKRNAIFLADTVINSLLTTKQKGSPRSALPVSTRNYTQSQLRTIAQSRGLPTTGTKAQLEERINASLRGIGNAPAPDPSVDSEGEEDEAFFPPAKAVPAPASPPKKSGSPSITGLRRMKINDLRQEASRRGVSAKGSKDAMVQRLIQSYNERKGKGLGSGDGSCQCKLAGDIRRLVNEFDDQLVALVRNL